jgi:hypothetical protein
VRAGGPAHGRGKPEMEGGRAGSDDGARRSTDVARAGCRSCWRRRIARRRGRGERQRRLNGEEQLEIAE